MGRTVLLVRTRVGNRPVVKRYRDCRACYDGNPGDGPCGKVSAFPQVEHPERLHCAVFCETVRQVAARLNSIALEVARYETAGGSQA